MEYLCGHDCVQWFWSQADLENQTLILTGIVILVRLSNHYKLYVVLLANDISNSAYSQHCRIQSGEAYRALIDHCKL